MDFKLSPYAQELLDALRAPVSLWKTFPSTSEKVRLLKQISDSGEIAAVSDLLPFLFTSDATLQNATRTAIHSLMAQLQPADFVAFDEFARRKLAGWRPEADPWYCLKPAQVPQIAGMAPTSVSIFGVATFHKSGYVRERALHCLDDISNGSELPFILLRLNDWVSAVRILALRLAMSRMRPDYSRNWLRNLPLVIRLKRAMRADHSSFLAAVFSFLSEPAFSPALQLGLSSKDPFVRRFCLELILAPSRCDLDNAIRLALRQADPHVRFRAAVRLSELPPAQQSHELLQLALADAYMPVRRLGLRTIAARFPDEARAPFERALLDHNVAIRQEAQHYFRAGNSFDLRDSYLRRLTTATNQALIGAVAGVGETGTPEDASSIESFLSADSPRVRAAAIRSLARLSADRYLQAFVSALADSSPRVSREAALALAKFATRVGPDRLSQAFRLAPSAQNKQCVLRLILRLNKWDAIALLVPSLIDSDPSIVALTKGYIDRWSARFNRSFVTPTPEQLARLHAVLVECRTPRCKEVQELQSLLNSRGYFASHR